MNLFHETDTEKTFSVLSLNATDMVMEMQKKHKLSGEGAKTLGELLMAAALFSTNLLQDETVTLTAEGLSNGATAVAIADSEGRVRGFYDEAEDQKIKAIPMLKVMRRAGLSEPRMSFCALEPNSIAKSLQEYYRACEQTDVLCRMETKFSKDFEQVDFAGAVLFVSWTRSQSDEGESVKAALKTVSLPKFLKANGVKSPLEKAIPDMDFLRRDEKEIKFQCNCSLERMETALQSIGEAALSELLEDEFTEIECKFCRHKYLFSKESVEVLLEELRKSKQTES